MTASAKRRFSGSAPDPGEPQAGIRCDFCGQPANTVRRVALDRDYERLRTPHKVRYACPDCSERKERQRERL